MKVYSLKYYTEVLGVKPNEMELLLEAMKGTLITKQ
jgi:hypothetical protein